MSKWPEDKQGSRLWAELMRYPEAPCDWRTQYLTSCTLPMIETRFQHRQGELRFFSTLTSFLGAGDVTIEEARIECMHPADKRTEDFCRAALT
jgi:hypothetical protein